MVLEIVWFKRDLRLEDNIAVYEASLNKSHFLGLFIIEPTRLKQQDFDPIHLEWEYKCAQKLRRDILKLGGNMIITYGEVEDIFNQVISEQKISKIHSHQETGTKWSYDRDLQFAKWCKEKNISWKEYPTNAVVRGLKNRDDWYKIRTKRLMEELVQKPKKLTYTNTRLQLKCIKFEDLNIRPRNLTEKLEPGEEQATKILNDFLYKRGRNYRFEMSSPLTANQSCSRLSPYISTGCISIRKIINVTSKRINELKAEEKTDNKKKWINSLNSFKSRLAWHCHFIQKLELQTDLNTKAMNHQLDLRLEKKLDEKRFEAWSTGNTGWPFFDACMRQLLSTGWINFRMRAMMMSVASYTLWLPWKDTGNFLARQFLDYEPGIHWSQVAMQSGTTGINTVRAYSILKQSTDHDPDGVYIRKWVPELSNIPTQYIHEPWKMSKNMQQQIKCKIGIDYPKPLVSEKKARLEGVSKSYKARGNSEVRKVSKEINKKHGSRKKQRRNSKLDKKQTRFRNITK